MQIADLIVHAKWILTAEEKHPVLTDHALVINQGIIKDILPTESIQGLYSSSTVEEYPSHVVMPGLINAHTHIGMNFFRGLGSDVALMDWLNNYMFPAEKKWLSPEFVKDASLFAMAEMIRGGTTCFNDMFYFLQSTAQAAEVAGVRAAIGITVIEFPTNWAANTEDYFTKGLAFYEEYKNHPLITVTCAPHAPYTVSDQSFIRIRDMAEQFNLKINVHLHETLDEINQSMQHYHKRPIQRLHDLGVLSSRVLAIHSANLNEEDMDLMAATGIQVIHCPESNMKLASGICPVAALQSRGINVALGTDSVASNNDLDMISEMRSASFLSKISNHNSLYLKAPETLALATINGAKALGLAHQMGSLTQGKAADFIAMDLDDIETLPIYDPLAQVIYSSGRHQVTDVWVGGKALMKNRKLLTLDEQELIAKARYWGKKISSE